MSQKLCPDGLVFNDYSSEYEKCDLPYNIDCSKRPKLRKWLYLWVVIRWVIFVELHLSKKKNNNNVSFNSFQTTMESVYEFLRMKMRP